VVDDIARVLEENGLPPDSLVLEMTESVLMDDNEMLKIDRSFVERLSHASDNAELARTIVRLGQSLQLVTVAEGVEDSTQFLALRRMGCDIGQGYYVGRSMGSEEISRLLGEDLPTPARKPAPTG
jgi:EAL domain-containing protein (putative c-di-GMP-specific phosphodiesterase class I)